ncbi:MAG: T9SS C-terminal target domain-containing protein [Ignavibacteriales bacterium]|nr:MAG: T9SS C-terminal target domain-containing protein [Ignavibacteriales bacterium]
MKLFLQIIVVLILHLNLSELYAQWTKTSGPYGANIASLVFNNNHIIAGTNNGIYRTTFESMIWQAGNENLFGNQILDLAVTNEVIFAGTDHGLFISSDNGLNWSTAGLSDRIITNLAVKDTLLFAGTVDGIFVSSDRGLTWSEIDSGLVSKNVYALTANSDLVLVSTLYDGLYKSSDNGMTWVKTNINMNAIFAVTFLEDVILASSWSNDVYRSTDWGVTWMSSEIGDIHVGVRNFIIAGQNVYAATNDGVFLSTDGGIIWQQYGLANTYIYTLIINNTDILAGTNQGAYLSTDNGINWTELNFGLLSSDVTSLAYSDSKLFAGTFGFGVSLSTDDGNTWFSYNNGLSNKFVTGIGLNEDYLIAGTHGGLFRSGASSDTWTKVSSETGSRSFIFNGNEIIASSYDGVLCSTDNGISWKKIDSVHDGGSYYQTWDVLKINQTIIAGYNQKGIRISTDNGLNWQYSNTGFQYTPTINSLELINGRVLAGTPGGGVFISSDEGQTWFQSQLDTTQLWTLCKVNQYVFGGGSGGICQSRDGFNWKWINQGLNDYFVQALSSDIEYLFAGVTGGGVWRRLISELTFVSGNEHTPFSFSLSQNYPNPFNSVTNINYSIQNRSLVIIKLYDILGRELRTLVMGERSPGMYTVEINANDSQSGIYFYRMQSAENSITKKFILLK